MNLDLKLPSESVESLQQNPKTHAMLTSCQPWAFKNFVLKWIMLLYVNIHKNISEISQINNCGHRFDIVFFFSIFGAVPFYNFWRPTNKKKIDTLSETPSIQRLADLVDGLPVGRGVEPGRGGASSHHHSGVREPCKILII